MAVVICEMWVTADVETLYLQVICDVFEEMRQKYLRRGNQWEHIGIGKII